ncbi:hypothetical protein CVT25_009266 [Psilocybe cyanescens]|uniref:Uncharacterized protein n=1 Tax=Psilocybe cyanescens TaxID=93625 RepID=A0A409XTH9_PSICY|nr:hypothetical protein CVT25_009266 [Psilocybe cyanescens]
MATISGNPSCHKLDEAYVSRGALMSSTLRPPSFPHTLTSPRSHMVDSCVTTPTSAQTISNSRPVNGDITEYHKMQAIACASSPIDH